MTYSPPSIAERSYIQEIMSGFCYSTATDAHDANVVRYSPIQVPVKCTVSGIILMHAVGAGNFYVALYDHLNWAPNNRLAVSPSTLCNGNLQKQFTAFIANVQIEAGVYFGATIQDNGADSYNRGVYLARDLSPLNVNHGLRWFTENLGAYLPPPAVATPVMTADITLTLPMWLRVASIP